MTYSKTFPDNFTMLREGNITLFVRNQYKEALKDLGKKVFDFSGNSNDPNSVLVGRGRCLAMPLGSDDTKIIIRRYHHGGFLGAIVGDLFWNQARPLNELLVCEKALNMGLSTVEVLAVIKRNLLYPFFKAEIVTKEITNAFDLINCIEDGKSKKSGLFKRKKRIIREIALAVQKMHNIGIYHGDLHLKNILLKDFHDGNFRVYIIDLDKSRLSQSLGFDKRAKNLYRLDRSVEKLAMLYRKQHGTYDSPFPVSRVDRVRFCKEYMQGYADDSNGWKRLIRCSSSSYKLHKIRWYLFNKMK